MLDTWDPIAKPGHALLHGCSQTPSQCRSTCMDEGRLNLLKDRSIGKRQRASTLGKTRKMALLSIKTQRPAYTVRFHNGKNFSSHAGRNMKPRWNRSFSPSFGRGRSKEPSFLMANDREGACILANRPDLVGTVPIWRPKPDVPPDHPKIPIRPDLSRLKAPKHDFKPAFCLFLCSSFGNQVSSVSLGLFSCTRPWWADIQTKNLYNFWALFWLFEKSSFFCH